MIDRKRSLEEEIINDLLNLAQGIGDIDFNEPLTCYSEDQSKFLMGEIKELKDPEEKDPS